MRMKMKYDDQLGCGTMIFIVIASFLISWAITCGIIKLITLCFNLNFNLAIATGIWLCIQLIQTTFKSSTKK